MKPVRLFLIFAGFLISFHAVAAEQIGVAVEAQTQVIRSGSGGGKQVVQTSTPVYLNDKLRADSTGLAQIKLADDTKIVVGPDSNVTLDDFVFSSSDSASLVTVSVTKGAFRWISGRSGSKAYRIKTPAGSIGVRGTAFDVTIQDNSTDVLLLDGQVTVCPGDTSCATVRHRCEFVSFDQKGIHKKAELLKMASAAEYTSMFPLIHGQERLNQQFRRESSGCQGFSIQNTFKSIIHALFVPFTPPPRDPPPPPVVPDPPALPGNPGNGGTMGNAGSNPSGRGFGNTVRGVSDLGPGGAGGNSGSGTTSASASDPTTGSISASATSSQDSVGPGNSGGNGNANGHSGGNGVGNR